MYSVSDETRKPIFEGVQGENEAREIQFDVTAWVEELGEGVCTATAKRPTDTIPYPVTVTRSGNVVTWKPNSVDTAIEGIGAFQLEYSINGSIAKTRIWNTKIAPSLDPAGDPPDPYDNWLAEMRSIEANAIQAADDAEAAAASVENTESKLDGLSEKIRFNSLDSYFYKADTYQNASLVETPLSGYDLYKFPCKQGEFIYMTWQSSTAPYQGLNSSLVCAWEDKNGVIARGLTNTNFRIYDAFKLIAFVAPANCAYMYFCFKRTQIPDVTFQKNHPYDYFADNDYKRNFVVPVNGDNAVHTKVYLRTSTNVIFSFDNASYSVWWIPVKKGDKIKLKTTSITGLATIATFLGSSGTIIDATASEYTFEDDGVLCVIDINTNIGNATLYPAEQLKVDASNVLNLPAEGSQFLNGKVWCSFGDSITYQNKWQPLIIGTAGGTHENCGIGSTPLGGSNANAFWQDVRLDAVKATNADILTILGGANDLAMSVPVGTDANLEDKDTSTFIGAYSYIIDNLLTWKPSLKIFIMTTTYAHNNGRDLSQTLTYDMYADASKKVAEYYHLPCVDLYEESGFNQYTMGASPNNIYSADHIHPNDAGAKIIAAMVLAKFKEVLVFN